MRELKASVVVVTYNWPEALAKTLRALATQDTLPLEVVVADDGSGDATRDCLYRMATGYPVPLRHCWQPDLGFRAARARNRAIAAASGDYVILLDGDMLPHSKFVSDHLIAARRGSFVQGMRVLTTAHARERLLRSASTYPGFFDAGIERRRHTLRIPWLARLSTALSDIRSTRAIKTCNQGWWRDDLVALNGFDERFEGWGREDKDLAVRAVLAGLRRRSLRFAGLAVHLHHAERHDRGASPNDALLAETIATRRTHSVLGIDRHLDGFRARPLPDLRHSTMAEGMPYPDAVQAAMLPATAFLRH